MDGGLARGFGSRVCPESLAQGGSGSRVWLEGLVRGLAWRFGSRRARVSSGSQEVQNDR